MPARNAAGTNLLVGTATDAPTTAPGADTFTAVGQVQSISGPNLSKASIDVTALESLVKQFIGDAAEPGTVDFDIYLDPANAIHQQMLADIQAVGNSRNWRISILGGTQLDFVGEVTNFGFTAQAGNAITASMSVLVSGAIAATWGT